MPVAGSGIDKRSVVVAGHRTSVSLEPEFWQEAKALAARRGVSLSRLVAEIDAARTTESGSHNLSSAIRLAVLRDLRRRADSGRGGRDQSSPSSDGR